MKSVPLIYQAASSPVASPELPIAPPGPIEGTTEETGRATGPVPVIRTLKFGTRFVLAANLAPLHVLPSLEVGQCY